MLKQILTSVYKILIFAFIVYCAPVYAESPDPVRSENGMVVSADKFATDIGVKILKQGGNAIDAAVAVGFALAVTYPRAGNIGGGGFMVLHLEDGTNTTIDYREKAPISAFRDMYLDENGDFVPELSQEGVTAAGVPGSVAGMLYALEKYGTMDIETILQPAIDLAKNGFPIPYNTMRSLNWHQGIYKKYPSTTKIFVKDTTGFEEGELLVQTDLAKTLEEIKNNGRDGFYKGWVADSIVAQMERSDGYITHKDLEKYEPVEREPIIGKYREHTIVSMPPPSSGGIALVQLLNILENFDIQKDQWGSSLHIHRLVEAMKRVYADRAEHLGDMDFYDVPLKWLISKDYANEIFRTITSTATSSDSISYGVPNVSGESEETTHYSIYDKHGNAVSVTTTINGSYGCYEVVDGAGFFLNNEMDDFSSKPGVPNMYGLLGSDANSIQPEKRMLSSMTPTIVLKDDKPYLVVGSPGGSTIITVVLQVIMNCIDFNLDIATAINMPRIHHQWKPDKIYYEKFSLPLDVKKNLENMGHNLGYGRMLGLVEGIMIDHEDDIIYGATDARGNGLAKGY